VTTLHVDLGEYWRGGQNQALLTARGLRARGHSADLLVVRDAPLARRALREGIPVHAVGRRAKYLQAAVRLRQLLAHKKYDVLHLHEAHGVTAAWLARAHRRTCVMVSRRLAYRLQSNPFALARYRAAHRILVISRFVAESVLSSGLPAEQLELVYEGIEFPPLPQPDVRRSARQRWGVSDNHTLLGCVGYLLPEKGQESLIRALPAVRAQLPTCRLLLAGDGPCRARLERLTRELGVESAVHFAGFVEDIQKVYAALDVFLFPSLAEPLGTSLLAAMSYALPVVAVAQGAGPEVVEDGRNGLLVPASDSNAIASAIVRLLGDAELAARLGAAARETIQQRFTADHMVENTLRIYQQVSSAGVRA
jgi:glycosyltransferase involved in cell wall biosynthesis